MSTVVILACNKLWMLAQLTVELVILQVTEVRSDRNLASKEESQWAKALQNSNPMNMVIQQTGKWRCLWDHQGQFDAPGGAITSMEVMAPTVTMTLTIRHTDGDTREVKQQNTEMESVNWGLNKFNHNKRWLWKVKPRQFWWVYFIHVFEWSVFYDTIS